ncbi:MAG: J domain-containing protein [Chloroflexi bacterium]|nr:J domain-containing protein [Chloroflexota bacterium]
MEYKDYYKILGVAGSAPEKEIKTAYRKLARQYHPDVNPGDKTSEEKFKEINEAYEVLSDEKMRKKYDQFGKYGKDWDKIPDDFNEGGGYRSSGHPGGGYQSGGFRPGGGGQSYNFNMEDLVNQGEEGFSDFFQSLFGNRGRTGSAAGSPFDFAGASSARRPRSPAKGRDIESEIELTLEEAVSGGKRSFALQAMEPCSACRGTGIQGDSSCPVCRGAGFVSRDKKLEVAIPPGVREGSKIRVKGQGEPGPVGQPGDLFLIVKLEKHPVFTVEGSDLHCEVPITIPEAVFGGEISVPSLKGTAKINIPPHTQSGKKFRLAGLGMPDGKDKKHGNLYARVEIVIPEKIDPEMENTFKKLAEEIKENPRDMRRRR